MPRIPIGSWADSLVEWLRDHAEWLFHFVTTVLGGFYDGILTVLSGPTPLLLTGIFAVIAWWLRGLPAAVLTFMGFALVDSIEQWHQTMQSLSLVLVACIITVAVAVPLGVWAARNRAVSGAVRPVLDLMQTMPAMVYLIPGILFFGLGAVPGIVSTIVFSMPPAVRMTELGIRQVDGELVEAADAFGTHPRRTLFRVQLPLALPTIMAGINQVIMLALSMVVIAGMVGGAGLGGTVYLSLSSVDVKLGAEGGLAVVILAVYLDRMTSALNQRVSPLGRRALAKAQAALGGLKFLHWKPATSLATVAVVVLALLAGGMSVFGKDSGGGAGAPTATAGRSASATSTGTRARPPPSCGRRSSNSAGTSPGPRPWTPDRSSPARPVATSTCRPTPGCRRPTRSTGRSTRTSSRTWAPGTTRPPWRSRSRPT